jgi:predicted RNA-binding Zn-ribbon protein involved in translation (DUF1610 family)
MAVFGVYTCPKCGDKWMYQHVICKVRKESEQ